ncbi:bleomycin resistance protein [Chimaeribacter californicus]|uniref:Bleomycin resistance protein n=1 Tax=Chimaeribacter californicus TaxID=2060067 RepID=A0A2N5DZM0_9GAMM|nr:L-dopachrome tautomerase-related protein [Chimaeribacter californicus]PLR33295.1 bleomycin resistance protein [Chimaeribacter californicus]
MRRREFISGTLAALCLTRPAFALAQSATRPALQRVFTSPWLANGVAVSAEGAYFINLPRFEGHADSPALARVTDKGPVAFPGNHWNTWRAGDEGVNSLVNVNACHIFDNLLWAVDQGAPPGGKPQAGAAKLVAFDIQSGEVKKLIRFDANALPEGGSPNDLRIHGDLIYVTDSGLGGILIHDMKTGLTRRKLSAAAPLRKPENLVQKGFQGRVLMDADGKKPAVHSDVIEVTADGSRLYYATPTGPLFRIRTAYLLDDSLDDNALEKKLEKVADIPSIGGSAIDAEGNIYLSDAEKRAIERLRPDGSRETLIQDDRLVSPDALVISRGWMYIPAPQIEYLSQYNQGKDQTRAPWSVYRFRLPDNVHPA